MAFEALAFEAYFAGTKYFQSALFAEYQDIHLSQQHTVNRTAVSDTYFHDPLIYRARSKRPAKHRELEEITYCIVIIHFNKTLFFNLA